MASKTTAAGDQRPPQGHPTDSADPSLETLIYAIAASRGCSIEAAVALIWHGTRDTKDAR